MIARSPPPSSQGQRADAGTGSPQQFQAAVATSDYGVAQAGSGGHFTQGRSTGNGGFQVARANAAASHMRSHSSPPASSGGLYDDKRALATANQIMKSLSPAMPSDVVVSRIDQLRLLIESCQSIFPVWNGFERLADFCSRFPTREPQVLTSMLLLTRIVLDTALAQGPNGQQFSQHSLNVPTLPSVFMACLGLLPVAVRSSRHSDATCRGTARGVLQALLSFTRDAPSAVLHRLGLLAAQDQADAGSLEVRIGSVRALADVLCTGDYWPNSRPPRFDEAEFYSAIRSLVACLRDPDSRITCAAEDALATMQIEYAQFGFCIQKLPLDYQDNLRRHAGAIDQKVQNLKYMVDSAQDSGRGGDQHSRSAPPASLSFGMIPADTINCALSAEDPVRDRIAALRAVASSIDENLRRRNECLMYHAAHLGGLTNFLAEVLQSSMIVGGIDLAVQALRVMRRLIRFVGMAAQPFLPRAMDASLQRLQHDLQTAERSGADNMNPLLERETILFLHSCFRTVGPMFMVSHFLSAGDPRAANVIRVQARSVHRITNTINEFLLDFLHRILRQAGWGVDVVRCVQMLAAQLALSTTESLTERLLSIFDTLWAVDPALDFLSIVGGCPLPNTDVWVKRMFERKQHLMTRYLDEDLRVGDDEAIISPGTAAPIDGASSTLSPSKKVTISPITTKKPSNVRTAREEKHPTGHYNASKEREGSAEIVAVQRRDERPIQPMGGGASHSDSAADHDYSYTDMSTNQEESDDAYNSSNNMSGGKLASGNSKPPRLSAVTQKRRQRLLDQQRQKAASTSNPGDLDSAQRDAETPPTSSFSTPRQKETPTSRKNFLKRSSGHNSRTATPTAEGNGNSSTRATPTRTSANAGGLFKEKEYLDAESLQPLNGNVARTFEQVSEVLSDPKAEWSATFKALDNMRRIAVHHGDVVDRPALHALLLAVLKSVNNLRSSVSKNALLCLGDLFRGLGRRMDTEIATVLPDLLKRCADTNKFVNAEALKVMDSLVGNCTPGRVLNGLSTMLGRACTKDARVRAVVAKSLRGTLEMYHRENPGESLASYLRTDLLAKLNRAVVKLTTDASAETRQHGVGALWSLIDGGVRREDLVSLAPKTGQLEKMMSRGRPAQLRPRGGQSAKQRGKGGATPSRDPKPVARQQRPSQRGESGGSSSNATLEQVEEISGGWTKLKSWSDRCDHLERLTSAVRENPKAVVSKLFVVMDVYSTGVSDGNSKVAALALQSMSRIIPLFGSAIAKVLHLVMPPLCKVAGSSSSQIQELCSDFLDRVASAIPPAQGVVAFTNSVDKYCKSDTARALLVQKITALLQAVWARNPGDIGSTGKVVQKKVVPMVFRLLGGSSVAFRADLEQLLHVLLEINPEACDNETRACSPRTTKLVEAMHGRR